ncbi:uncharacterized protein LODBEIA_P15710 [Lodderomyces beijingensis]|uniref:Adenylyl cyclase-associated protein n=1 Tax=Lodderomyces beijingensis TaxID=1775926 RepID=A0ABP0ZGQ7_9ASCO
MSTEESQFNVQGYNIVTILKRLEAATSRLEDITVFQEEANKQKPLTPTTVAAGNQAADNKSPQLTNTSGTGGPVAQQAKDVSQAAAVAPTPPAPSQAVETPKSVQVFQRFVDEFVNPFIKISNQIDSLTGEAAQLFGDAFAEQAKFLAIVAQSQKPDMTDAAFAQAMTPTNEKITKINALKDANRKSPYFNHLNSLSESGAVFFWIAFPTPVSYISDTKDSAKFWLDRVLKDFKGKDKIHLDWVNQVTKIFDELKSYVKEYHTTGPSWNAKGEPFAEVVKKSGSQSSQASASAAAAAAAPPAAPPAAGAGGATSTPPPPPPPPASVFEVDSLKPKEVSSGGGMNAVFAQLNQGANVTSGLKKVQKSEMTHKNPELRKQPPVAPKKPKSLTKSAEHSSTSSNPAAKKEAKKELVDGTKWIIQNLTKADASEPIIIETEMHQSVFIGNCSDITIQLKGKANAVAISEAKNIGVVVDSLISGVEIIKAFKYGVQVTGVVSMISVDKSDEGQIYLSAESIKNDCQVFTSSSTALNINTPEPDGDFKEQPVPEQFVSTIKNGKLVSAIVEHAG